MMYRQPMRSNMLVDQFHVRDAWRHTEDISFVDAVTMDFTLTAGQEQKVPITFAQAPMRSFNQVPGAESAFLVLRHLDVCNNRLIAHRSMTWMWNSTDEAQFTAVNGGGTFSTSYDVEPAPSGLTAGNIVPIALRRIRFGTIPAMVTITKIEVKPPWGGAYDDLHLTSPITGSTDIGVFYDSQLGMVNAGLIGGTQTTIQVKFTYTNTSGANQTVPYNFYGLQMGSQWAQWLIEYESYQGGARYAIGMYDDVFMPVHTFIMDKLIPVQINDMGITNLGNLIFTLNQIQPFNATTTTYNLMLTATVAYLVPEE